MGVTPKRIVAFRRCLKMNAICVRGLSRRRPRTSLAADGAILTMEVPLGARSRGTLSNTKYMLASLEAPRAGLSAFQVGRVDPLKDLGGARVRARP